jgi:hypothetical protein
MSLPGTLCRLSAFVGLIGILSSSLSGCGGGDSSSNGNNGGNNNGGNNNGGTNNGSTNRSVCTANAHVNGRAYWTVLVYMNAANNLQPDSLQNIAQMMGVGSDSNVNIVVQWKQASCSDCGNPSFIGTQRYLIRPHSAADVNQVCQPNITNSDNCLGNTAVLAPDRLADPATNDPNTHQSDMGDYRVLKDFVTWGAQAYPADHLALVIWDHGAGWSPTYPTRAGNRLISPKKRFRAVSIDNETQNEIETWEIPQATAGVPLDMIIFDASLEQMVEIAYEIRSSAKLMVGSEESPPGQGYPYDKWMPSLKITTNTQCDVGKSIVDNFVTDTLYLGDSYNSTILTQSVIDLTRMDALATSLNSFASSLRTHVNDQASVIRSARDTAQSYKYPDNKDLYHYTSLIRNGTSASDLGLAAANLQTALTNSASGAIFYSRHGPSGQANSNGLAIYIPSAFTFTHTDPNFGIIPSVEYAKLALAKATLWDEFLGAQVQ